VRSFFLRSAAVVAFLAILSPQALAAAESGDADQQPEQSGGKPSGQSDGKAAAKTGSKGADKPDDKSGDKSDDKPGERSKSPPEANTDSKPQDPCNTEKQLIKSELRDRICKMGVKLGITETSEVLGNPTGGIRQGALYEGVTDLNLGIDLRPMFHVRGNIFARAYQIHGRGLSANNLRNLNLASSIEAERTTRLNELWYEQHFDNWRLRIGQQTIGTEFFNPDSSRLFVNSTFGWPTQPSLDLPSGGPGYPLATPAIRVRIDPMEGLTVFTALFNGDPTGAGVGGSQLRDASGTAFRTSDGAWAVAEIRYNPDDSDKNGAYRLGGWYNSERFRDLRFDTNGNSLASPGSNGRPRLHDGDYTVYVNVDQPVLVNEEDHTRLTVFARSGVVPTDRNLIDLYADAGLTYGGAFGRADDRIGLAIAYARVGSAAQGSDADVARFTGSPFPVRTGEIVLELTYQFQVTPWWQVQPDFQYIFNPGGGIPNPIAPARRIGDAAVLGLRTAITF
jgi:porin